MVRWRETNLTYFFFCFLFSVFYEFYLKMMTSSRVISDHFSSGSSLLALHSYNNKIKHKYSMCSSQHSFQMEYTAVLPPHFIWFRFVYFCSWLSICSCSLYPSLHLFPEEYDVLALIIWWIHYSSISIVNLL